MSVYVVRYLAGFAFIAATDIMIHGGIDRGAIYFILLPSLGIVIGLERIIRERRSEE